MSGTLATAAGETTSAAPLATVILVAVIAVVASVVLHGLCMRVIYERYAHTGGRPWLKLSSIVLVLLLAHLVQIALFAVAYLWLDRGAGDLVGDYGGGFGDAVYFSAAVYTTVGFGDITPVGHLRLLVGIEALTGLML
ncbi:MAG: potassium channel family protein, partial [Planctomycetota bacterium]